MGGGEKIINELGYTLRLFIENSLTTKPDQQLQPSSAHLERFSKIRNRQVRPQR